MVRERERNKERSTAGLLAVFLGQWTFVYTWKDDWLKFVICSLINMFLWWTIVAPIGVLIYAMVIAYGRDDAWYIKY